MSVADGAGGTRQGEELREESSATTGARDDEVGVDLLEGLETWTSSEKHLVGRRMGRRRMVGFGWLFGSHENLP